MANPENDPQFQEKIEFRGKGELLSSVNLSLNAIVHLLDADFSQTSRLYREGILRLERLVVGKRKYTIKEWAFFEPDERKSRLEEEILWAILFTEKEVWLVKRNPNSHPIIKKTRNESFLSEEWLIFSKTRITEFLKLNEMARDGRIHLPGTQLSIKI